MVERYKGRAIRLYFRGDAAFASPEIYDYLEAESMFYATRAHLLSPGPLAAERGPGGRWAYRLPVVHIRPGRP